MADWIPLVDERRLVRRRETEELKFPAIFKSTEVKGNLHSLHRLHLLDVGPRGEGLLAARHHHAAHGVVAVAVLDGGNLRRIYM